MTGMHEDAVRRRHALRLGGYDYSETGMYFVTVCAAGRALLFGAIRDGEMRLSDAGRAVELVWNVLPTHYSGLRIDAFVVMPNHLHGIIIFDRLVRAGLKPAPTNVARPNAGRHGLPEIVRAFKTFSARHINQLRGARGAPVWQRGYYGHVIRRGESLDRIRRYIAENPARWAFDREIPQATDSEPENARTCGLKPSR